jgi:nicotinamidase-related amidase
MLKNVARMISLTVPGYKGLDVFKKQISSSTLTNTLPTLKASINHLKIDQLYIYQLLLNFPISDESSTMPTPSLRQVVGMPNSTASVKDSVLVIIDAQDEYIYGSLPAQDYKEANVVISSLLDKYRKQNGHVVHVLHRMNSDEAPVFSPNGMLTKEMDGIEAIEGEAIVWKKHAGSFSETNLAELVNKTGLKKLVLTGYMAHGCVSSTAREATTLGYETLVVEDGVGQRDMKDIPAAQIKVVVMTEIDDMFGTVVKSSQIN